VWTWSLDSILCLQSFQHQLHNGTIKQTNARNATESPRRKRAAPQRTGHAQITLRTSKTNKQQFKQQLERNTIKPCHDASEQNDEERAGQYINRTKNKVELI